MPHFEVSQEWRKEMESNSRILEALDDRIESRDSDYEHIATGTAFTHFRVGHLESGICLATREPLKALFPDDMIGRYPILRVFYEVYCQNAAYKVDDEGEVAPRGCIGVVKGEKIILVVEDLTGGGEHSITHTPGLGYGYLDGDESKVVWTDLDPNDAEFLNPASIRINLKYMLDDNLLKLDHKTPLP